MMINNPLCNLF